MKQDSLVPSMKLGTLYCVLASVSYALMNICQRKLSGNCDPVWVNSVQAMVSTSVLGIYLVSKSLSGRPIWPSTKIQVVLIALGVLTQLGGSSYLWSLGVVGLAVGNPLSMGIMLAMSAIFGLIFLGEKVTWQAVLAIALVTLSIFLLSSGAANQQQISLAEPTTVTSANPIETDNSTKSEFYFSVAPFRKTLGVLAACFGGLTFAVLTVGIRKIASESTAPEAIVFFINAMGVVFLGPWAVLRLGMNEISNIAAQDYAVMLAIGTFNLMGFFLVTKGLQLTNVVRVNIITNAMTTTLTILAGIVLFLEPTNREIQLGITLILFGILLNSISGTAEAEVITTQFQDIQAASEAET